jgi:hypothetical protein
MAWLWRSLNPRLGDNRESEDTEEKKQQQEVEEGRAQYQDN